MNHDPQTTNHILMVRPAHFGFNPQTAESNAFQTNKKGLTKAEIEQQAVEEFDEFVNRLRAAGVDVIVVQDTPAPVKTDAVFPNNWITFHPGGQIVTYPMESPIRRLERRDDIIEMIRERFQVKEVIRLEQAEKEGRFLEGTGSMILDRQAKIIYACRSSRTDKELVFDFAKMADYDALFFDATDGEGHAIYHTNVMMAIGETFVVICLDTIKDSEEKAVVIDSFEKSNKEIISITLEQMMAFAGNMLQVQNNRGQTFLVMSEQAYRSLTKDQVDQIERHTQILYSPLDTIETYGGGSARCMMAEVFLPEKD